MKKIKQVIRWTVINALMAALLWFGFGPDRVDGARYLYTFALGFCVFMVTVAAFNDEILKEARAKGRPVHGLLCYGYDIVSIAFLVWLGHWVLGLLIVWEMMCLAHIYNEPAKEGQPA